MSPHTHLQTQPGNTTEYIRADGTLGTPGGGGGVPIGGIIWWSPLNGAVPTGFAECDGTANAPGPDLRDRFVVGRGTGHTVDTTGGADIHAHSDNLSHAGTAVAAHVVTQPGAHVFTQPSGHSAHVVTQPSAHSDHADNIAHVHTQRYFPTATGGSVGHPGDTSMSGTQTNETLTTVSSGTGAALAHSTHAGTAVDAHSAHAGGAVDAHAGTAVDAHAVTQPSVHTAHAAVDSQPTWYALIAIQRMT